MISSTETRLRSLLSLTNTGKACLAQVLACHGLLKLWPTSAQCASAVTLFGQRFVLWNCDCCAQTAGITS